MNNIAKLNNIKQVQRTIDDLLLVGNLFRKNESKKNNWVLEPLHQGKSCSIGFVYIDNVEAGPCEEHIHIDSKEYLIVIQGSIMLNINGQDVRILKKGECGVVGPGELHYSKPLEDNTKLAYLCVPADPGMNSLIESLERQECKKK